MNSQNPWGGGWGGYAVQKQFSGSRSPPYHEAKVTSPSRELRGENTPRKKILNFGLLKKHFLVKFPPTRHIEALN